MFKICILAATLFSSGSYLRHDKGIDYAIKVIDGGDLSFIFDETILKIDARDPNAYEFEHLPGSVNATLKDVTNDPKKVISVLDGWEEHKMVIYCYGTSCDSSMNVARYLIYRGYQIYIYKSGWSTIGGLVEHRQ